MSDGNPQNGSIWPVVTVIVGIVALGALGWDVMLQGRVKKMEERIVQVERARAAAAAPTKVTKAAATDTPPAPVSSSRRRRGAATRPATTQSQTKPAAAPADGSR
jgi:hypothetical protein